MATKSKLRVLIVDDEAPARSRLRHLLKHEPDIEIAGEAANGRQAIEAIVRDKPAIVFLDIQMPGMNGLDVCRELALHPNPPPLIIFVTAYDRYALQAFEVHAGDYLLKPFDSERLQKALAHARGRLLDGKGFDQQLVKLLQALQSGAQSRKLDRLILKVDGKLLFLAYDRIDWVEADGNYVRIHCGAESHFVRETLANLESQLPANKFVRISRFSLVNIDRVKEMQPLFYGDYTVVLQDGSTLNLSRNYRNRIEQLTRRGAG